MEYSILYVKKMIDCRFVKNKYIFNIISQRLKENMERLNQETDKPYMTVPGFPFEVSEIFIKLKYPL